MERICHDGFKCSASKKWSYSFNYRLRSLPNGNGLKLLKRIGYSNIDTRRDDGSAFFYEAGLNIDADGAPHGYHPDGRSGLDYLGNAGRPGNWWALVTDK
jgi:hypothetical protein